MRFPWLPAVLLALAFLPTGSAQGCALADTGTFGRTPAQLEPFNVDDVRTLAVWYDGSSDPPVPWPPGQEVRFEAVGVPSGFEVQVGPAVRGPETTSANWSASVRVVLKQPLDAGAHTFSMRAVVTCDRTVVDDQTLPVTILVAYEHDFAARAPESYQRAGQNSKAVFAIELENAGNAPVRVDFDVEVVDNPDLVAAAVPPPDGMIVAPREPYVVRVTALTHATNGEVNGTTTMRVTMKLRPIPPNASVAVPTVEPVVLDLVLHVSGTYLPAPGILLAAAAGAGAAWVRRQRL